MATKPTRKHAKLILLLGRLQAGVHVPNRELKKWLTSDALATYESEQAVQQQLRCDVKTKPLAVLEYERRVRLAQLAYNKGEGASVRGKSSLAQKNFHSADMLCEQALEYLQEIVAADLSLCVWFDRDTTWTADSEVSAHIELLPKVVTSRSLNNRGGGLLRQLRAKRDLKLWSVEMALAELADQTLTAEGDTDRSTRLERLLALGDND